MCGKSKTRTSLHPEAMWSVVLFDVTPNSLNYLSFKKKCMAVSQKNNQSDHGSERIN